MLRFDLSMLILWSYTNANFVPSKYLVFDDVQTVFSTRPVGTVNPRFNETPSSGPNFGVWVLSIYLTSPVETQTIRVNTCQFWEKIWKIFFLIFVEFVDEVTVQKANFLTCPWEENMRFCILRDLSLCLQWQDVSTAYFQQVQFFKHFLFVIKVNKRGA